MDEDAQTPKDTNERQRLLDEVCAEAQAYVNSRANETAAEAATKLQIVSDLVDKHRVVLVAKRRMLLRPDEYGLVDPAPWQNELNYFIDRVLRGHLAAVDPDFCWMVFSYKNSADDEGNNEIKQSLIDLVEATIREADDARVVDGVDAESLTPSEFERFCADELRAAGWETSVMGTTGDQGVDVVARCGNVIGVFQCKYYADSVGNAAVQEVHSGRTIYGASFAVVVARSVFTPSARAAALQTGVRLVHYSELRTLTPNTIKMSSDHYR